MHLNGINHQQGPIAPRISFASLTLSSIYIPSRKRHGHPHFLLTASLTIEVGSFAERKIYDAFLASYRDDIIFHCFVQLSSLLSPGETS